MAVELLEKNPHLHCDSLSVEQTSTLASFSLKLYTYKTQNKTLKQMPTPNTKSKTTTEKNKTHLQNVMP